MRTGTCKHYNGNYHNKTCGAGVCYRDVTPKPDEPGSAFRKPCDRLMRWPEPNPQQLASFAEKGTCEKYAEPTKQEIEAYELEMRLAMKRMELTFSLIGRIKSEHKESWSGVEICPACGGKLHLQLNCFFSEYQGTDQKHLHGRCETQGCVSWIE